MRIAAVLPVADDLQKINSCDTHGACPWRHGRRHLMPVQLRQLLMRLHSSVDSAMCAPGLTFETMGKWWTISVWMMQLMISLRMSFHLASVRSLKMSAWGSLARSV